MSLISKRRRSREEQALQKQKGWKNPEATGKGEGSRIEEERKKRMPNKKQGRE